MSVRPATDFPTGWMNTDAQNPPTGRSSHRLDKNTLSHAPQTPKTSSQWEKQPLKHHSDAKIIQPMEESGCKGTEPGEEPGQRGKLAQEKTGSGKTKPRKNKNRKESNQTKNWTYGTTQHGGIATNKLRPIPAGTNTGAGRHPQKPAPGRSTPPSQAVSPELLHAGRSKHAWKRRPRHRR